MIKSVLEKPFKGLTLLLTISMLLLGFRRAADTRQLINWSNRTLMQAYDPPVDEKLKKWELSLTDDLFLRLRKTYQNGKQEYFSFQLHSFNDLDYVGTTASGLLNIKTRADDIIVQTYNDRKGNVDSMATILSIPVKNMEPEQIDSLRNALLYFKSSPVAAVQ